MTHIIVNDFKSEKLYSVNFINKQILHHSVGVINKIIWRNYYADNCPATIVILSNVATPKNCTITWQQTSTTFLQDSTQMLVQNSVSFISDDCLKSVKNRTDKILHSGQWNWSPRFPKTMFECCQCSWLLAGINSCSHDAPILFNWRQIWRNLLCTFCTRQLIVEFSAIWNIST